MSAIHRLPALLAVAAALVLAGCSAGAPDGGGDGLPADAGDSGAVEPTGAADDAPTGIDVASLDACTILTRADAEALVGTGLTEPLSTATSDVASCTYPGDPNGPTAQVEIYIGPGAQKQLEIDRDTLEHAFTQPAGVGEEAWQEDFQIFARTGPTWVSIRIVVLEEPAGYETPLQTAMAAALSRLG